MTHSLGKADVDVAALLDTTFQVRFVEIGEREACIVDEASELVLFCGLGGRGVDCAIDARAAEGGYLGADW